MSQSMEASVVSKFVERIARAICVADGRVHPDGPRLDGQPCWRSYESQARAALTSMYKPTVEMREAGFGRDTVESTWQAMIDAALTRQANDGPPTSPSEQALPRD